VDSIRLGFYWWNFKYWTQLHLFSQINIGKINHIEENANQNPINSRPTNLKGIPLFITGIAKKDTINQRFEDFL